MSTKNTILKAYDGRFKDTFQDISEKYEDSVAGVSCSSIVELGTKTKDVFQGCSCQLHMVKNTNANSMSSGSSKQGQSTYLQWFFILNQFQLED